MPNTTVARAFLLSAAIALGGCASQVRELMPTPAMFHSPATRSIFEQVPLERRRSDVDLLYITDRAPNSSPEADLPYGQSRSRSLAFGAAVVRLLPQMDWDDLERHSLDHPRDVRIGLELGQVNELGRYPTEPYPLVRASRGGLRRDPAVLEQHQRVEAQLRDEVRQRLQAAPSGQVVLYVHGFNETFATAAYTAAELCHFLGRAHVCAFFTWPASSGGNPLFSYTETTESAQFSVGHLKKVIRALAQTPGVKGVQLLARSRGAAVLLSAVRELAIEAVVAGEAPAEALKLENLILMSPDIDGDVASQQIEIFASDPSITNRWTKPDLPRFLRGRLTIYSSPSDRALDLSRFLFRSRERIGQLTPDDISPAAQDYFHAMGNFDIVVYEGKRTDFFGHSYFHSNPEVSTDLIELIRNGTPPGTPGRPLIRQGKVTWVFPPRQGEQ